MPKARYLKARNFAEAGPAERATVFGIVVMWAIMVLSLIAWALGIIDCPLVRNWWLFCGS